MRANRKSLIIWSACMILLVLSGMAKYTTYSSGPQSAAVFNDMPHSVKVMLGMGSFDVTTISGFFAMLFLYTELAVSIHAALLGSGIISKEERDKTSEFLMIKPVSRISVISSKLLAAFVNVLVVNIVTSVTSVYMVASYNKGASITREIVLFMISMFLVQIVFLSIGAAAAAVMKNPKRSGSVSIGILLIGFIVSKITDLTDNLNFLNIISPFKYFDYVSLADGKGLNPVIVILSLLLAAILTSAAYYFYPRRDLQL